MRGGPINTRRVVIPNSNVQSASGGDAAVNSNNIEDIMLKNKEKILDKIPKNGQVSNNIYSTFFFMPWI